MSAIEPECQSGGEAMGTGQEEIIIEDEKRSSLFTRSSIAILDQALLSAVNFIVSIILIKTVSVEDYGHYSITFAVAFLFLSIQNAVVTTPLAVLLASKIGKEKEKYVDSLYWGQLICIVPIAGIGLVGSVLLFSYLESPVITIIESLCFAMVALLLREFSRAYFYAQEMSLTVLKLDCCYVLAYTALIALAYFYNFITVPVIFVLMGVSSLLATFMFHTYSRQNCDWEVIQANYRENWDLGRWALLGVVVTHVQSYANIYLLGAMLSSAEVARASASRLPLMPLSLLQSGWSKIAIPRGAHLREQQQLPKFYREQATVSVAIASGLAVYIAFLLASEDFLRSTVFTTGYENALDLIVFWGAIQAISYAALNASIGLQVITEFSIITKVNTVTMVITLCLNYFFIKTYGIKGSLVASLVGELLFAVILWWLLRQCYFQKTKSLR